MSTFDQYRQDAVRALGTMFHDATRTAESCGDTPLGRVWRARAARIEHALEDLATLPGIGSVLAERASEEERRGALMAAEIEDAARQRVASIMPGLIAFALASGGWPDYRGDLATVLRADYRGTLATDPAEHVKTYSYDELRTAATVIGSDELRAAALAEIHRRNHDARAYIRSRSGDASDANAVETVARVHGDDAAMRAAWETLRRRRARAAVIGDGPTRAQIQHEIEEARELIKQKHAEASPADPGNVEHDQERAQLDAPTASERIRDARSEAERERIIDARVQRRLATDPAYLHAEDAEAQAAAEERITEEEEQRYDAERRCYCPPDCGCRSEHRATVCGCTRH